jgi:hypothetical protein
LGCASLPEINEYMILQQLVGTEVDMFPLIVRKGAMMYSGQVAISLSCRLAALPVQMDLELGTFASNNLACPMRLDHANVPPATFSKM